MSKVVVISGGSFGIGQAIVKKFSGEGYRVFNLDITPPETQCQQTEYIQCDVTSVQQIKQAIDKIQQLVGSIDILISNAGKHYSATIEETTEEKFYELIDLNLKGTFFLISHVLPLMKAQNQGSIILMSSDQCFIGKPNSAIYGVTKAAIGQLAKSTAIDYAKFNIRVNAVCAGTIDTPLYRQAINRYSQKSGVSLAEIEKNEAGEQLLNRIGLPAEVAELVYFLSGSSSGFITGGLFPIDGGYTAQ